jgi:hypothetical protein
MRRSAATRALADFLMLAAGRLMPRARAQWAEAMRSELHYIDDDFAALSWAFSCCVSSVKFLVREWGMKRPATVSFVLAFALGATIWWLSPFVTGIVEPWDADSPYYIVALVAAGLITGWLCPRRIWPILPGLALGQFAYAIAFVPMGPLFVIGFVFLFVFALVAIVAALASSRLRRLWSRSEDSSRPSA